MPIKFLDTTPQIKKKILRQLEFSINKNLNKTLPVLRNEVRSLLEVYIKKQPHYGSLLGEGGDKSLRAHFGIPAGTRHERVQTIITQVVKSVQTTGRIKAANGTFLGRVRIFGVEKSYNDLFSLPQSTVITEKGVSLPWLQWLLTFGDTGIIEGYDVKGIRGRGRSGLAIMIEQENIWGVPSQFASSGRENWLTLAIDSMLSSGQLVRTIKRVLTNVL